MKSVVFEKDTLLDISVNLIPLGILAFFIAAFLLVNPWGGVPTLARALQFGIVIVTGVVLTYVTYQAAVRIEGEESESESDH